MGLKIYWSDIYPPLDTRYRPIISMICGPNNISKNYINSYNLSPKSHFNNDLNLFTLSAMTVSWEREFRAFITLNEKNLFLHSDRVLGLNQEPYPERNDWKFSISNSIWIKLTLTQRCRSISKLARHYLKNLRFFWSFDIMLLRLKLQTCFVLPGLISAIRLYWWVTEGRNMSAIEDEGALYQNLKYLS